jgi:hypothetical protein
MRNIAFDALQQGSPPFIYTYYTVYTAVQKDPHFLFLLSTTASPTICQAACTIEEGFISDYDRGFIFAHE